jgi:hypothetical protein
MTSWIEPPPRQKGMGCLGKGCLSLFLFLLLLAVAFVVGGYVGVRYVVTSTEPRDIPQVELVEATQQVQTTEAVQTTDAEQPPPEPAPRPKTARERWDEFEAASRTQEAARLELTADDLNQLIAGNRNLRKKAFISIENNIARVQVSIPLEKIGFRGRYLNGDFAVRSPADRDPRNLQVTANSMSGVDVPERFLKYLLGTRSLGSYVDEYSNEYHISSLAIDDNKVIVETNGGTLTPAPD